MKQALIIGNSDGIGLELTRDLLNRGYSVVGISKRESPLQNQNYTHHIFDVTHADYRKFLETTLLNIQDLNVCVYCAGIGNFLKFDDLASQTKVFEVNLMAGVITTELALNKMNLANYGHFIGLSSIADSMISSDSPSYSASKSAVSKYWEGLGQALLSSGKKVRLTNIRFGFVNTKMAQSPYKPFMISCSEASKFVLKIINKPKIRATKPWRMGFLVWLLNLSNRAKQLFQNNF